MITNQPMPFTDYLEQFFSELQTATIMQKAILLRNMLLTKVIALGHSQPITVAQVLSYSLVASAKAKLPGAKMAVIGLSPHIEKSLAGLSDAQIVQIVQQVAALTKNKDEWATVVVISALWDSTLVSINGVSTCLYARLLLAWAAQGYASEKKEGLDGYTDEFIVSLLSKTSHFIKLVVQ